MRVSVRWAAIAGLVGGAMVMATAHAESKYTSLANQGPTFADSGSTAIWTVSTKTLTVKAKVSTATMNAGMCVDGLFDWNVSGGHFDARITRRCGAGESSRVVWNNTWSTQTQSRTIIGDGLNKRGACLAWGGDAEAWGGYRSCYLPVNLEGTPVGNCDEGTVFYAACARWYPGVFDYWGAGSSLFPNA